MLKAFLLPLILLAGLLGAMPMAFAQAQPGNLPAWPAQDGGTSLGNGFAQPFSGPLTTPGSQVPGSIADPVHLAPPPPATILRPLTAARPVVIELFTSEGCASCPPADSYLAELAQRRDLLALSYHVDYWDYIGWRDRFAAPAYGQRQRDYANAKGENMVYTPQAVIAGAFPLVGSDRVAVAAGIRDARNRKIMADPVLARTAGGDIELRLPATPLSVPASLWFVTFAHRGESDVTAGENSGQRMVSVNVVRSLRKIGQWNGSDLAQSIRLTPEEIAGDGDACAVIVNEAEFGPIVAAAAWNIADLR